MVSGAAVILLPGGGTSHRLEVFSLEWFLKGFAHKPGPGIFEGLMPSWDYLFQGVPIIGLQVRYSFLESAVFTHWPREMPPLYQAQETREATSLQPLPLASIQGSQLI